MKILIVDDEKDTLFSLKRLLKHEGFNEIDICDSGTDSVKMIKNKNYDVVLLDLLLPDKDGMEVLQETKPFKPETEIIMVTAVDDVQSAVKSVRLGAYDYLIKPLETERLVLSIRRAFERKGLLAGLKGPVAVKTSEEINTAFKPIITNSLKMKEILLYTEIMAQSGNPIMITGESGTGKELLARGIHEIVNQNKNTPFVAVNVSSVPETLFESQFFGHSEGAFTGASKPFIGYFKQAQNGTLFLDEVGELPLNQQVKFLRVLEDKIVTPVGESRPIPVNAQIVSATNVDIDKACRQGKFRLDLLYRLRSAHIHLPPLRERDNDIVILAKHFMKKAAQKYSKQINELSPEVISVLRNREFPGNVRELSQLIGNAVLVCNSTTIYPEHIGEENIISYSTDYRKLCSFKENYENHLFFVLNHTNGDKKEAAKILDVTVRQIQRKVAEMKNNPQWTEKLKNF